MRIISGALRGRVIKTVQEPGYRPAMGRVREAVFSILEARGVYWPTAPVLDLFAGSGALAFEALSRGAPLAQCVENAPLAVRCLRENARVLGFDDTRARIIQGDVGKVLAKAAPAPFMVIFIDPPYGDNALPRTLRTLIRKGWLAQEGIIAAEVEARTPFDAATAHPQLTLLAERFFGQTRILLWMQAKSVVPSSPAPLIP